MNSWKHTMRWGTFFKIAIVMIISLLCTNLFTSVSSAWISKFLFIETSTVMNMKLMEHITENIEANNLTYLTVIRRLETESSLRNYFYRNTSDSTQYFINTYDVIETYREALEEVGDVHIVIFENGEKRLTFDRAKLLYTNDELRSFPFVTKLDGNDRKLYYTYVEAGVTADLVDTHIVMVSRRIFYPSSTKSYATALISIPEESFYEMFADARYEGSQMYIVASDATIISSNEKSILGNVDENLLDLAITSSTKGYTHIDYEGDTVIAISKYIPQLDMYMLNLIDETLILSPYENIQQSILLLGFVVSLISILVVFYIISKIVSPLSFFVMRLEGYKHRKFEKVDVEKYRAEIKQIASVYNDMVDEIDTYVEELLDEQKRSRKLEIEALQMQINPHFMYNTLASIKYLAWEGNKEGVSRTIHALISILKKTVGNFDEEITLGEEIAITKEYVYINQVRFGDAIETLFFVPPYVEDALVPKLMLQPFIENIFFHAFQEKKAGKIRVFIGVVEGNLVCEIIDDGDGIAEGRLQDLLKREEKRHITGIGMHNVDERLHLMYGSAYGVKIHSKESVGTSIVITLPHKTKDSTKS